MDQLDKDLISGTKITAFVLVVVFASVIVGCASSVVIADTVAYVRKTIATKPINFRPPVRKST